MTKKLVIVESPAKARTMSRILGKDYNILASVGHVRDLPQKELGVDIEDDFRPKYVVPRGKQKVLKGIRDAAKEAKAVYLATDPDREGEAISWHLVEAAKLGKIKRVVFHEITQEAVSQAFRHPRDIDISLVNAQQARRVLDRLVGYRISPLLWRKVRPGLSAGRVQSVALRMIADREDEVEAFIPEEYWSIEAELARKANGKFRAKLIGHADGSRLELKDEEGARALLAKLENASYTVAKVGKRRISRNPAPPFITSTLQQEAWRKLRFSAKRTMALAQQLYEGLPLGKEGSVGLITYMRTDSVRVSAQALSETRDYISENYGADFLPPSPRHFTRKSKGAQEAHEAIRPTSVRRHPQDLKSHLTAEQLKLYQLIWQRMVASQMAKALVDTTSVDIAAKKKGGKGYLFRATSSIISFPGFLVLYSEGTDEEAAEKDQKALPELAKGEDLRLLELFPEQHFTQPPPRYNEATLVKALEENGIGRPSTYAPIISLIQERGYVSKQSGRLEPTELGRVVNGILKEHFTAIVDTGFTAQMEEELDGIARGQSQWVPTVRGFYLPLEEMLVKASVNITKLAEPTEETCEQCGRPMVIKWGRGG
ncbi:type I DNA topoisomerase, partial [Chloroflexota bacterium]